jgi:hypothetical protein
LQKDFHYDIVYALAKEAGYTITEANIIAYASQYVDDNTDREYTVSDSSGEFYIGFPEKIGRSGNLFFPIITQAEDITSFKLSVQRYVYAPFHFIPGDNNVEIKGMKNPLCTTRGCRNAEDLVLSARKSKDIYRIGVALHTYADTFSHERFSAFNEDWNKVYTSFIGGLPPNIGHAEVFHKPDEISITWEDKRLKREEKMINNRKRALEAAEKIFGLINKKRRVSWENVKADFERFMDAEDSSERIQLIKDKYPEIEPYDEDRWLSEALSFTRDASEIPPDDPLSSPSPGPRPRFVEIEAEDPNADWFRFQNAAKKQLAMVLSMVDAL